MNGRAPKTSNLAVAALVLAVLCFPIGFILGIVAYVKINNSNGQLGGKDLAIAAMVLPVLAVPVMGILAAIAIPNFVRFQLRSKQSEAKTTLLRIRTAQALFFEEHGGYVAFGPNPSAAPSTIKIPFDTRPCPAECKRDNLAACTELACVGFGETGSVYFRYACETTTGATPDFTCAAVGDLDGDGELGAFVYGSASKGTNILAPVPAIAAKLCGGSIPANELHSCTPAAF